MSISAALSNAYSGLTAMSRSAEIVSNNVSNALTEGYSRQEVSYSAKVLGGRGAGVATSGATRVEDIVATSARRRVEADLSGSATRSSATSRLASILGEPGDPSALATRYAIFETAIDASVNAPDSVPLQNSLLIASEQLADTFTRISQESSRIRMDADASINRQVNEVNLSLSQIENLNGEIRVLSMSGRSIASLEDRRQLLVDKVNSIIPIKQSQVGNGEIAIFTNGGEILLNGSPRELGFNPSGLIAPEMSLGLGSLSGLTLNGKPVAIGVTGGMLEGGSLSANFELRDVILPKFHQQLDSLARDLIERFQDPAVDLTIAIGGSGLFTDAGTAFILPDETGLALRISVNTAVDPSAGGELWRLRDGVGAIAPGLSGDASLLIRYSDTFNNNRAPLAGLGVPVAMRAIDFAEEISSLWALTSSKNEEQTAINSGMFSSLRTDELNATGVDTDRELQTLLMVEQTYAANARVISVIDGLMKTLLEM